MQKFTRFYGKVAYLGMISDFSTSLRFLFYELISGFQILISVISPRAYEISPSVGPLGLISQNVNQILLSVQGVILLISARIEKAPMTCFSSLYSFILRF